MAITKEYCSSRCDHVAWIFLLDLLGKDYEGDAYFPCAYKKVKDWLIKTLEGNEFYIKDGILYKLDKLCTPQDRRIQLMK